MTKADWIKSTDFGDVLFYNGLLMATHGQALGVENVHYGIVRHRLRRGAWFWQVHDIYGAPWQAHDVLDVPFAASLIVRGSCLKWPL